MVSTIQYANNPWEVREAVFNSHNLGKYEAIFALGNGYMGSRAATEEHYVGEKRDTFINGTFDKFDADEVTELPNMPDIFQLRLRVQNQLLDLNTGSVTDYQRTLNLQTGELTRQFKWQVDEHQLNFHSSRFVSFHDRHVLGSRITITNDGSADLPLVFESGIDGQQSNSGSQHFNDWEKRQYEDKVLQYVTKTNQSNIVFVITAGQSVTVGENSEIVNTRTIMPRRQLLQEFTIRLAPGESLVFEKNAAIFTSRDNDVLYPDKESLQQNGLQRVDQLMRDGYQKNLQASIDAWQQKVWEKMPITIDSPDNMDQLSLNFARYHLHAMTPAHDERMNVGAKGLTGEGYKGHTFWDTEMFILPYFIFNFPDTARKLVKYRYLSLGGARRKAAANGFKGAQYPWESAWINDGESTPIWGGVDIITGKATKILSGFIEQHITADVAYGTNEYISATQDRQFAERFGYEVILDTARFWTSRVEWCEDKQRYEIRDVIGPNEYKEHANNNAFTNYIAHWNMQLALDLIDRLKQESPLVYDQYDQKMDLVSLRRDLMDRLAKLYLPQPNAAGVIPEDDTYLSKQVLDLQQYRDGNNVGALFDHFNLDQVNHMQITKQADVILLLYLFEKQFSAQVKHANWNYYEPKTTHDSSLSMLTHTIFAADLGLEKQAEDFYERARLIDLGPNMKSSDDGIHAASLGGIWNMVIFGFGGVRYLDGQLRINPNLPKKWRSLDFRIWWHQQELHIHETQDQLIVENLTGSDRIHFEHHGEQCSVDDTLTIDLKQTASK